ncbi:hypothetical protein ACJJTC_013089 [Scirpophaga incertulas]
MHKHIMQSENSIIYSIMIQVLTFISLFCTIYGTHSISLYGDVLKDKDFFIKSFPWIIDNIGGELRVEYYLQGSGRYSIPQMCVLKELTGNTYLQAQYLKCEAQEKSSSFCLCESGIDPYYFKECVRDGGHFASLAAAEFTKIKLGITPLIDLGSQSTVFEVTDEWYLKKICTIFGDDQPLGCVKPFQCNSTEVWVDRKAIAHFDKNCYEPPVEIICK